MLSCNHIPTKLRAALDSRDQRRLKTAISQLPTSLPQVEDSLEIARCLEEVRVAADVFIEACDFDTAFESAVRTRAALITAKILPWAVSVLKNFAFEERVVGRVALTLEHLGGGMEPRGDIGAAGAVDQLGILWKSHPSCVAIVDALISLCTGHIDNISRFMRRRGITTAITVLNSPDTARNSKLEERIMILVGLCAICTPDNNREGTSLVPAILGALKRKQGRTQIELTRHTFIAIANMAECWTKEEAGYDLGDVHGLVELVAETWISVPRSREMAFASSWALAALYRYNMDVLRHLKRRSQDMIAVHNRWRSNIRTVEFLASLTEAVKPETKRTKTLREALRAKSRRSEVVPDPESLESNTHKSESDAEDMCVSGDEGDLTDREKSPVSVGEASIENQTIIVDYDSDDEQTRPFETVHEPKSKTSPNKTSPNAVHSTLKEIPIIILDSDSDDQSAVPAEPKNPAKSKGQQKNITRTRRRKRSAILEDDITHTEVSTKKPREEMQNENLNMRRSKRQRRPNPKYQSSPRRQGTRLLRRTKIGGLLPMVSSQSIVPPGQGCQVLECRRRR